MFPVLEQQGIDFLWRGREALYTPLLLRLVLDLITFCEGREMGSGGRETRTRYLQWCPTWSSFQGFFFH